MYQNQYKLTEHWNKYNRTNHKDGESEENYVAGPYGVQIAEAGVGSNTYWTFIKNTGAVDAWISHFPHGMTAQIPYGAMKGMRLAPGVTMQLQSKFDGITGHLWAHTIMGQTTVNVITNRTC